MFSSLNILFTNYRLVYAVFIFEKFRRGFNNIYNLNFKTFVSILVVRVYVHKFYIKFKLLTNL